MTYAICYNQKLDDSKDVMLKLSKILASYNLEYKVFDIENLCSNIDFAFIIGGDGTILKAGRFFAEYDVPIFGINLGRLGFLSQAHPDNLENCVSKILSKDYKVEKRLMLKANGYTSLNDFVVKSAVAGRVSRFLLEINDKFVCEYSADGIIVSTPTGSTAYGMASGGPILAPNADAIAIVPICPHTFSARPIVVSANDKIKIKTLKNNGYTVFADGQVAFSLSDEIVIEKSEKMANLALLKENDFYSVLRNKLHWGISPTIS